MNKELMDSEFDRLRNLAQWSPEAWRELDIHDFIAANFNRYCTLLLKKVGMKHLPSDAPDCLLSLFCDVAYKPLHAVHSKHLDLVGERRNQVMLGTLKMISVTRMVDALIKEYPSYVNIDQFNQDHYTDSTNCGHEHSLVADSACGHYEVSRTHPTGSNLSALGFAESTVEEQDEELEKRQLRMSKMVEMLRSHLTPVQYQHIRYTVCDGLDAHEIAAETGHSVTNVRIMLLNARKKMLELVPKHLHRDVEHYVFRR